MAYLPRSLYTVLILICYALVCMQDSHVSDMHYFLAWINVLGWQYWAGLYRCHVYNSHLLSAYGASVFYSCQAVEMALGSVWMVYDMC